MQKTRCSSIKTKFNRIQGSDFTTSLIPDHFSAPSRSIISFRGIQTVTCTSLRSKFIFLTMGLKVHQHLRRLELKVPLQSSDETFLVSQGFRLMKQDDCFRAFQTIFEANIRLEAAEFLSKIGSSLQPKTLTKFIFYLNYSPIIQYTLSTNLNPLKV